MADKLVYESFKVPVPDAVDDPARVDHAQSLAKPECGHHRGRKVLSDAVDILEHLTILGHTGMGRIAGRGQSDISPTHERDSGASWQPSCNRISRTDCVLELSNSVLLLGVVTRSSALVDPRAS